MGRELGGGGGGGVSSLSLIRFLPRCSLGGVGVVEGGGRAKTEEREGRNRRRQKRRRWEKKMKGGRSEGGGGWEGVISKSTQRNGGREREYLEGGKEGELWEGEEGSRCNGAKN